VVDSLFPFMRGSPSVILTMFPHSKSPPRKFSDSDTCCVGHSVQQSPNGAFSNFPASSSLPLTGDPQTSGEAAPSSKHCQMFHRSSQVKKFQFVGKPTILRLPGLLCTSSFEMQPIVWYLLKGSFHSPNQVVSALCFCSPNFEIMPSRSAWIKGPFTRPSHCTFPVGPKLSSKTCEVPTFLQVIPTVYPPIPRVPAPPKFLQSHMRP